MANFEKKIKKLIELQKLKDKVDYFRKKKKSKNYDILEAIKNNEKLNLSKESVIGILLTIKL